ncbi:uncharacterized protein FIBRA_06699 [Fibroporia radiculosa]|uniref:Uncharacterized protein n=1 Tax=Fibroporia radiculosa TaxID=599839 RepID=J4GC91_9APHY|nr:uncharacterized protein FIBRA_06699 [Fibroporia radiculosa]CCM04518.1 predicted protein [Fibroporia radiculosa]
MRARFILLIFTVIGLVLAVAAAPASGGGKVGKKALKQYQMKRRDATTPAAVDWKKPKPSKIWWDTIPTAITNDVHAAWSVLG